MKRTATEPETRVGHCCGCRSDGALYKIPGLERYRCAPCFKEETGFWHHLAPRSPSRILLP